MLETMPYIAKQKRQARKRRNLLICFICIGLFTTCVILLNICPMPENEIIADGESLYNCYLLLVSIACFTVIGGITYLIKALCKS